MQADKATMTPEQYIKTKAHNYIMLFHNNKISFEKSKLAAVVMVLELKEQYFTLKPELTPEQRQKVTSAFSNLINAINAF